MIRMRRIALGLSLTLILLVWAHLIFAGSDSSSSPAEKTLLKPVLMTTTAESFEEGASEEPVELLVPEVPFSPVPILPDPAGKPPVFVSMEQPRSRSYPLKAYVTGYCPCDRCCGKYADGLTSTLSSAWKPGIAVDPRAIPYGSKIEVPGYGIAWADDTGIAMRQHWQNRRIIHLDLRFLYHWQAKEWGTQSITVTVTPPAGASRLTNRSR